MPDFAGRRVLIMGLGTHGGGVAVAEYAAQCGAEVVITDLADESALRTSRERLAQVDIARWRLGEHLRDDFDWADVVVANPAVRPDHPLLAYARSQGKLVTSETEIFFRAAAAPVIGVTGTNGKSTTATMLAAILHAAGRDTWLGGNIGRSLLTDLEKITSGSVVVLELSSFQLAHLSPGTPLPRVAVVTGCTPNHLDWHKDWSHYQAAIARLAK